ncbi:MAG TPA: hypothetical protein VFU08_06710 [Candidatus Udaeobacter sp.]|jgi:hypothetical protein|nr:hypothetical protein [Candidatus Udaeobacter sp.]
MNIVHILNTFLLAAILAVLVLILIHIREPVEVSQPVKIQGWNPSGETSFEVRAEPVSVKIED